MKEKICAALDVDSMDEAVRLVDMLSPYVGVFKVGAHLFATGEGKRIIDCINARNSKIFLDLKYHDIPNTVANTAKVACGLGVYMFNVHATGGAAMMGAVAKAVREESRKTGKTRPKVLAVTVLTSISGDELQGELKVSLPLEEYVAHLARLAEKSGLDGVVCSPNEIEIVRRACGKDFLVVTPGIRPAWSVSKDDQKRVLTPAEAIKRGADYIVVGRPIIKADDPVEAAKKLLEEIQ